MAGTYVYLTSDPLLIVANARKALLANKARDFAAERNVYDRPAMRSVATGELIPARTRDEYNAFERSFEHRHLVASYRASVRRAMGGGA